MPTGSQWAYEIKHDGFRFVAVRRGKQVRIYSRGGHDWSKQLPTITGRLIVQPAATNQGRDANRAPGPFYFALVPLETALLAVRMRQIEAALANPAIKFMPQTARPERDQPDKQPRKRRRFPGFLRGR